MFLKVFDVKAHQTFQTITLHYQIDALGTILELRALRSTRASKPLVLIIKSMLWEAFRGSRCQMPAKASNALVFRTRSMPCE